VDAEHTLTRKTLRLSTKLYVKMAHPQCVDTVAIRTIATVKGDRLETAVRSASSGMDATDRHYVLRGPSVGIVPTLVRYRVRFSITPFKADMYLEN
jgi:hypothetical protein